MPNVFGSVSETVRSLNDDAIGVGGAKGGS